MSDLIGQYQSQTEGLAGDTVAIVAAIYALWQTGQLTTAEAEQRIAAAVATANAAAATLADAYVAAQIEHATATPTPAVGLPPADDTERLVLAARTILDDADADAGMRFERLARAEPLDTAQQHAAAVMRLQPSVKGWRLRLDTDACELCRWYAAGGRVYRLTRTFRQPHPGCGCMPEPVLSVNVTKERTA